jgi:hypothetical protein
MRDQKRLSLVETLLILVIIIIIGNVDYSRQKAGKSQVTASEASQIGVKQPPQQKGLPEKTDETADWITFVSSQGGFSLRHPKSWAVGFSQPQYCFGYGVSDFVAGANADLVAKCGSEYNGQIYVSSRAVCNCVYGNVARVVYSRTFPSLAETQAGRLNKSPHTVYAIANRHKEGNHFGKHKLEIDKDFYRDMNSRKVTVDNIEGARESGAANGQFSEKYEEKNILPGLPDGTKVVIYSFYTHGRTYVAEYNHRIGEPDILRDFDLMITKTLKFSN